MLAMRPMQFPKLYMIQPLNICRELLCIVFYNIDIVYRASRIKLFVFHLEFFSLFVSTSFFYTFTIYKSLNVLCSI
jgi:hypothetical protein